jgi:hypothetical protein
MKLFLTLAFCFIGLLQLVAQHNLYSRYDSSLHQLDYLLQHPSSGGFKKAVFITENTFSDSIMSEDEFNNRILLLCLFAKAYFTSNSGSRYRFGDSINVRMNFAIYTILKDSVRLTFADGGRGDTKPFRYDFDDFLGKKSWRSMLVMKLLASHAGNCHSLPYLYKILSDELGATCWLSLAPNHMYIKNRCEGGGWYNTELTSGAFPNDAWIMTSGYIPLQAVQSGIYMDTLSNQQSIALCVLDLAKEYEHQAINYDDGFILKCCDLSLRYFPLNVQAMLLKAETLKRIYEQQEKQHLPDAKTTFDNMQALYIHLLDLGYREMPDKMYQQWLFSIQKEKAKYSNKKLFQ